jgi:LysM domain
MSVMTAVKHGGRTRAAAAARRRTAAVDRGQAAGLQREERRHPLERPGTRAVRHLRVVPGGAGVSRDQAGPGGARLRGSQAVPGGARVRDPRAVPGAHRPGEASRAGDMRVMQRPGQVRDARVLPGRGHVRLTRRGRIVVAAALTALSLLVVMLAWMAVAARAQAADGGLPPGAVYRNLTSVVVHPGQSLWSIASRAEPTADPRLVMQQIIDLNALHGTSIEPGQHLWVPRG